MTKILKISFLIITIITFISCEENNTNINDFDIAFDLLENTDCKIFTKTDSSKQECVQYEYSTNILQLRHINSAFNCCPGNIKFDYSIINNVIIITEQEEEAACNCLCLYDLNYKIEGLPQGRYVIKFTPTYLPLTEEILEAEIDLENESSGEYCVNRNSYPWNI
jgi:hypothetical protein